MIPPPGQCLSQHELAAQIADVRAAQSTLLVEMDCDAGLDRAPDWSAILTNDEMVGFARLRDASARTRAMVRRAGLRTALGAGLHLKPLQVPLWHEKSGRPRLGVAGHSDLMGLSCSSSDGIAFFCLALTAEVGVDVEVRSDRRFPRALAAHVLHKAEQGSFERIPVTLCESWLTGLWVCKEAWLKSDGSGLAIDPCDLRLACESGLDYLQSIEFSLPNPCAKRGFLRWDETAYVAVVLPSVAPPLRRVRWAPLAV